MNNCKFVIVKPLKRTKAKLKDTVATVASLCIVCTVFIALLLSSGCNEKIASSEIDDTTFKESQKSVPIFFVPTEDIPEWLNKVIERLCDEYAGKPFPGVNQQAAIYRGVWKERTAYWISHLFSSCMFCTQYENGEFVIPNEIESQNFIETIKNWDLIFEIAKGEVVSKSSQ